MPILFGASWAGFKFPVPFPFSGSHRCLKQKELMEKPCSVWLESTLRTCFFPKVSRSSNIFEMPDGGQVAKIDSIGLALGDPPICRSNNNWWCINLCHKKAELNIRNDALHDMPLTTLTPAFLSQALWSIHCPSGIFVVRGCEEAQDQC